MDPGEIVRRKERCLKFLHGENVNRPLLGVMWEPSILPIESYVKRIDCLKPAQASDISAEEICDTCDKIMLLADKIDQDFFHAVQASFNYPWLNAALGCKVEVNPNTIWSRPSGATLNDIASLEDDVESAWLDKMFECHEKLVSHADNRYPVAVPWIDGPLDLLVSIIGPEKLGTELYDHPQLMLDAMDRLTNFWSRVMKRLVQMTKSFADGYVSRMHIWTEKPSSTVMDDATWMMSPENYERFVYPFEKRMIQVLSCGVYHSHNTSIQIFDFLARTNLKVLQVTIDTNGPSWEIQRREIASLQEHIPVMLSCWNIKDAERARRELSPRGLALTIVIPTINSAPKPKMLKEYGQWYKELNQ